MRFLVWLSATARTLSFAAAAGCLSYLYLLAFAAFSRPTTRPSRVPRHRFAIAIPAHNEEEVVGQTVRTLREMDYPADLFDIHIVADHCADRTVDVACAAGAVAHARFDEPRGSKGAALRWLFERILGEPDGAAAAYDAVVVFDADTRVAPDFLRLMDARLQQGARVIQGQHRIRNPHDGWFPALTWAMFLVDNRLQNLGRTNLGWSAKNMGDSICFRADVLRRLGWGEGLTEDYAFRQRLLLDGTKIAYEPAAVGLGEAPLNWATARTQRARWLRGTQDASRHFSGRLWREALRRRDPALLDGALQSRLPSYSTLVLATAVGWLAHLAWAVLLSWRNRGAQPAAFSAARAWGMLFGALFAYPFVGLRLERAPLKAYLVMLSGPVFIVWRTGIALAARQGGRDVQWIRTPRRAEVWPSADGAGRQAA